MWVVTNIDFEYGEVSDVYGPFKTEADAKRLAKEHAQHEYEEAKVEMEGVALADTLDEDGMIEVQFEEDGQEAGCLYQVIKLENG